MIYFKSELRKLGGLSCAHNPNLREWCERSWVQGQPELHTCEACLKNADKYNKTISEHTEKRRAKRDIPQVKIRKEKRTERFHIHFLKSNLIKKRKGLKEANFKTPFWIICLFLQRDVSIFISRRVERVSKWLWIRMCWQYQ